MDTPPGGMLADSGSAAALGIYRNQRPRRTFRMLVCLAEQVFEPPHGGRYR
jgi:hypothetical protein